MMETKDEQQKLKNPDPLLNQKAGVPFHQISQFRCLSSKCAETAVKPVIWSQQSFQ
jgi:hypothetical protein